MQIFILVFRIWVFKIVGWKPSPTEPNSKNVVYFGKDSIIDLLLLFIYFDLSLIFYTKEYLNINICLKHKV